MVKLLTHILTPTGAIRAWATTLMVVLGCGLAIGLTIGYVAKIRAEDDRKWCALLVILDTPLPAPAAGTPPPTERQRQIAQAIHRLRLEKRCAR